MPSASPSYHRKYFKADTTKPDRAHMQRLQDYYASLPPRNAGHPYTREVVVRLGVLYTRAWRKYPSSDRMGNQWCLPDASTIRRLFGTYQAYYAAIDEAREGSED